MKIKMRGYFYHHGRNYSNIEITDVFDRHKNAVPDTLHIVCTNKGKILGRVGMDIKRLFKKQIHR